MALSNTLIILTLALVAMLAIQRVTCNHETTKSKTQAKDVSTAASGELAQQNSDSKVHTDLQKQSILSNFLWPQRARENPDFFLIWMKPYEPFIPQQIQEAISQQVSPMTENISSQIISSVPGSEQMYQQLQQFMNLFQNFGLQNIMGAMGGSGGGSSSSGGSTGRGPNSSSSGSGLSGMIPGLGRGR